MALSEQLLLVGPVLIGLGGLIAYGANGEPVGIIVGLAVVKLGMGALGISAYLSTRH